MSGYLNCFDKA